ncbi:hypothetical protein EMCRGX_G012314 [Ephydatia muelleri]
MLRDRIVIGVNDPNIQRRLLAEPNLTLKKALEIAQALETAERIYSLLQPLSRAARLKLEDVLKKHADVFKEELGKVIGMEVKLHMESRCTASVFSSLSSTIDVETESGDGTGEIG